MSGHSGSAGLQERFATLQRLLGKALDRLGAGAYAVDSDGVIVAVNAQAQILLGRDAGDLLGQDAHDLLHRQANGMSMARSRCPMMAAFIDGRVRQEERDFFVRGDGSLLTASWLVTPLRINPRETGALVVFHQHDPSGVSLPVSAIQAGLLPELERLALLAETTTQLTATLDVNEALERLVRLVVPLLADWIVIDLVTETGDVQRNLVAHDDDGHITRRADLQGTVFSVPETSPLPLSRALRGAGSTLATPHTYQGPPDSPVAVEQRRLFDHTGMHSAVIAPIRGLREILGALTLGRSTQPEPFTTAEIPLVEDLTRRAGLALDNARLYQRQRKVAETMQRHLLPQLPRIPGLDMSARYLPAPHASQVGGDWYDVFHLPDRTLALVIGDVAGHDLDAAAGMAQLRNILRAYAWSHDEPLSVIVDRFDQALPHITDVAMATMILGRLQPHTGGSWHMQWTNAGHPPPLLVTHDGEAKYLTDGHGMLLGTQARVRRADATHTLPPLSTLVLYTDGLIESRGHTLDYGLERLRRRATRLARHPLETFTDALMEQARPFDNDDDVAMLAIRVPAPGPDTL
ncbi:MULTISPECIES: SpoIIE family protein phosphatase [unclassified Streptomyces]|uniref:SpoIIE family protein phosphatase n=1 Tax=unclassified Streptomyces TaxID=2593676 RepID=UPI00109ED853|nr:SpoIIE family protein phosphatase [Streptomyces sp. A1136]THA57994.1 GAF domain-containing protein [Streptomyces sp. A1136]